MPVPKEFTQLEWDPQLEDDCRQIVRLAVREELDRRFDLTTVALIDPASQGRAVVAAREDGVVCGVRAVAVVLDEMEIAAQWLPAVGEGDAVCAGQALGTLTGPARDLLTAERLVLNLLGRLSGIATLTQAYTRQVQGTPARIYDTRKTTPGWRRLEKFAVRCGGGSNHRTGLFDAVLIKDNHLAHLAADSTARRGPGAAVELVRRRLRELVGPESERIIVEIEVDSLEQLADVLPQQPDLVLLDNMSLDQLRQAVAQRDAAGAVTQLEASGGVQLQSVAAIARTGVDRISVGALTHSPRALDIGLDWQH